MLLTGSELTMTNKGIVPGETFEERAGLLTPSNPSIGQLLAAVPARVNDLLADAVRVVRERFGGKVSYASLPFEHVDWTPFDIVSTDAGYRSIETADRYAEGVRALVAQGKPVAVTEFGRYDLPHRRDPRLDLDMASAGVVKVLEGRLGHTYPDMAWEPKAAFTALADHYRG